MNVRRRALSVVVIAIAIGAGAWWLASTGEPEAVRPRATQAASADAPVEKVPAARRRAPQVADGTSPEATPPLAPPEVARLAVRVTDAARAAPLPGVQIEARGTAAGDSGELIAVTDDGGRALLEFQHAGSVELVARAPGHVRAERSVEVALDEERTLDVALAAAVAVEGRVVRDEDGTPIEGATVVAIEGGTRGGAMRVTFSGPLGTTQSDAGGRFRLDGLPPGDTATLSAIAAGRAAAETSVVPHEDAAGRTPVELRLPRAGTVRGIVRDREGSAVPGARVYLIPADAPDLLDSPDSVTVSSRSGRREALRTVAGDDGAYVVDGVAFGSAYFALARATGYATSDAVADVRTDADHAVAECDLVLRDLGALHVTVFTTAGELVVGADVQVRSARSVSSLSTVQTDDRGQTIVTALDPGPYIVTATAQGLQRLVRAYGVTEGETLRAELRLAFAVAIEGVVVDDLGRPLAGARVKAFRPTWEDAYQGLPESEGEGIADDEGRFRVGGLAEGPHVLWAQEKGRPLTGELAPVEAPGAGVRVVSVRRARLRFRLVPPQGVELPGRLHIHIGSLVHHTDWQDEPVEVKDLAPGDETVRFRIAGFVPFERQVAFEAGAVADLGEIALDAGWELSGRVVDAAGEPVAGAAVRWGEAFTPTYQDVTTDAEGRFRLEHLPAGMNTIDVDSDHCLGREAEVRAGPGEAEVRVVLVRGGLLRGTVRGPDGATLADVFVHVFDPQASGGGDDAEDAEGAEDTEDADDREAWKRTDSRGAFEARLLPGRYRVAVVWKRVGHRNVEAQADVELKDGAETPVVIDLTQ